MAPIQDVVSEERKRNSDENQVNLAQEQTTDENSSLTEKAKEGLQNAVEKTKEIVQQAKEKLTGEENELEPATVIKDVRKPYDDDVRNKDTAIENNEYVRRESAEEPIDSTPTDAINAEQAQITAFEHAKPDLRLD